MDLSRITMLDNRKRIKELPEEWNGGGGVWFPRPGQSDGAEGDPWPAAQLTSLSGSRTALHLSTSSSVTRPLILHSLPAPIVPPKDVFLYSALDSSTFFPSNLIFRPWKHGSVTLGRAPRAS